MANRKKQRIGLILSRVSGEDDPREASLESQEEGALKLAELHDVYVPPEYRFRENFTAIDSLHDRPVLNQCRRLVEEGKVEWFGSYYTDRLARDPHDLIAIVRDNARHGVETRFVRLTGTFEGRWGEMQLYMAGTASAIEAEEIADRTGRGKGKIRQAGKWLGGGPVRYGYIFDVEERRRSRCPDTAPTVVWIFEAIAGGMSTVAVVNDLNERGVPSPAAWRGAKYKDKHPKIWVQSTVLSMIKDRTYIGEVADGKTMATDRRRPGKSKKIMARRPREEWNWLSDARTEPLVSVALFEAANKALAARRARPGATRRVVRESLLRGLIWCANCGHRMTPVFRIGGDRGATYRCTGDDHARGVRRTGCAVHVGARWVEEYACKAVERELFRPGFLAGELAKLRQPGGNGRIERDLKTWRADRKNAERELARLLGVDLAGKTGFVRETFQSAIDNVNRRIAEADAKIADSERRIVPAEQWARVTADLEEKVALYRERWRAGNLTAAERRDVLVALGARVTAFKGGTFRMTVDLETLVARGCAEAKSSSSGMFDFCARITLPVSA